MPKAKTLQEYLNESELRPAPYGLAKSCLLHWHKSPVARKVFTLRHGNPGALYVLHRCDVPACIEDSHHWLGSQKQNIADMKAKGRRPNQKGVRNPMYGRKGSLHPLFGKPQPAEWKARQKVAQTASSKVGRVVSKETKFKISEALKKHWRNKPMNLPKEPL